MASALGSLALPTVSTPFSGGSGSIVPTISSDGLSSVKRMSPVESMQEVFFEIRDGISGLGEIFKEKISGLNSHLAFRLETLNNTMSKIGNIAAKDLEIENESLDIDNKSLNIDNKSLDIEKSNKKDQDKNKSLIDPEKPKGPGILSSLKDMFGGLLSALTPKSTTAKVGLAGLALLALATQFDKISSEIGKVVKFIDEKILPKAKVFYEDMKETTIGVFDGLFEKDKGLFPLLAKGLTEIRDGFKEDDPVKKLKGLKTIFVDGTIKTISVLGDAVFGSLNAVAKALGMDTPALRKLQLKFRNLPETIDAFVLRSIEKSKAQLKEITDTNSLPEATLVAARQIYDDLGAPVLNSLNKLVGIVFKPFMSDEYYKSVMSADFSSTSIKASLKVSLDQLSNVMNKLGDSLNVFANEMIDSINQYLPKFAKIDKIPVKDNSFEIETLANMEEARKGPFKSQYEPGGFMYKKYIKQREKVIAIDPSLVQPINDFEEAFGVNANVGDIIDGSYKSNADKTKVIKALEKSSMPPGNITIMKGGDKGGDTVSTTNVVQSDQRVDPLDRSADAIINILYR